QPVKAHPIESFDPANAVHRRVNRLCEEAGMKVLQGVATWEKGRQVHLGPLYHYLGRLQKSAEIPNAFVEGKMLPLDGSYVALTLSDKRRFDEESSRTRTIGYGDRADPVSDWLLRSEENQISIEAVTCRSDQDVVIFGDPGSGKTTLTHYILHGV